MDTNTAYKKYYGETSKHSWPLSLKEFNAKMSEDMEFYATWTLTKDTTPKNRVKKFLTNLIKL